MVDVWLDKLQQATDTFSLDQELRLEQFRTQMEKLLVEQQRSFEQRSEARLSEARLSVREPPVHHAETTFMFDSPPQSQNITEDSEVWDAGGLDLSCMVSDSESDVSVSVYRTSSMPLPKRSERRSDVLYMDQSPTSRDLLLTPFSGTEGAEWEEFFSKRRLKWDRLEWVVHHQIFAIIFSVLILSNGVYIGFVASRNIQVFIHHHDDLGETASLKVEPSPWRRPVDLFFISVFTTELVMRILGEELLFFFGDEWHWNWMDLLLVTSSAVDMLAEIYVTSMNVTSMRLLRLLRILRVLRSLRVLRDLHLLGKIRMLLLAIQHSVGPLVWACVLIFGLLYVAGLFFLNGVSEYLMYGEPDPEASGVLRSYFGALDATLLTLFMSISGGVSWEVLVHALMQVHVVYGLSFVVFIACMQFAALNIIAGIFVNDAIEMAQRDGHIVLQAESTRNKSLVEDLKKLFLESDTDQSGTLTLEEFMQAFQNPAVQARFKFLGVEITDAESLFEMLDTADTDEILIDEFVSVCLRAKTLTRPLDLQSFIQQNRRTDRWLRRGLVNIEHHLDKLAEKMDKSVERSELFLRSAIKRIVLQGLRSTGHSASPSSHTQPSRSSGGLRSGLSSLGRGLLGGR